MFFDWKPRKQNWSGEGTTRLSRSSRRVRNFIVLLLSSWQLLIPLRHEIDIKTFNKLWLFRFLLFFTIESRIFWWNKTGLKWISITIIGSILSLKNVLVIHGFLRCHFIVLESLKVIFSTVLGHPKMTSCTLFRELGF